MLIMQGYLCVEAHCCKMNAGIHLFIYLVITLSKFKRMPFLFFFLIFFLQQQEETDSAVQRNKDGLIYLSLNFDEAKSAKPPPPKHEKTEYMSIDLQKTASMQHNVKQN